jgi:hypothetical protein
MKKKFKNEAFYVKGPQSLLDALKTELGELGYGIGKNHHKGSLGIYPSQAYTQDLSKSFPDNRVYLILPQDWNKALQLASEEKEVIPEYVQLVKDWSCNGEYMGEVFKLSTLDNLSKFQNAPSKEDFRSNIQHWINQGYFQPSTKEAYEAQQNAPKFKEGDFISGGYDLGYIKSVKNGEYSIIWETGGSIEISEESIALMAKDTVYKKVSDEEALKMLKEHYAKQGIVEGSRVSCRKWNGTSCTVIGFKLKKDTRSGQYSFGEHYFSNSQLAILYDNGYGSAYISPDVEGFRVLPKEVYVAGYQANVSKALGTEKLIKIGCQRYTQDSLITIRDLIIHGIQDGGRTSARFSLSGVGTIHVTVDELNAAIKLLD